MPRNAFAGVRYSTNKENVPHDSKKPLYFGRKGEALSSMANLSSHLQITTCTNGQVYTKTVNKFNKTGDTICLDNNSKNRGHGSSVTVQDLFSTMPVRRASIVPNTELEKIQFILNQIALVHPHILFNLIEVRSNFKRRIVRDIDILSRFTQLFGSTFHFEKTAKTTNGMEINTKIHQLMKDMQKKKRSQEDHNSHLVYMILIQCDPADYVKDQETGIEFCDWHPILFAVQSIMDNLNTDESKAKSFSQSYKEGDNVQFQTNGTTFDSAVDFVCMMGRKAERNSFAETKVDKSTTGHTGEFSNNAPDSSRVMGQDSNLKSAKEKKMGARNNDNYKLGPDWIEQADAKFGKIYINVKTGCVRRDKPCLKRQNNTQLTQGNSTKGKKEKTSIGFQFIDSVSRNKEFSKKMVFVPPVCPKLNARCMCNKKFMKNEIELKLPKEMFQSLQVIGQVDNKFIACHAKSSSPSQRLLLLFDQHAVHERIRLESYLKNELSDCDGSKKVSSVALKRTLTLKLDDIETRHLTENIQVFANSGIDFTIHSHHGKRTELTITRIPKFLMNDYQSGHPNLETVVHELVQERIQTLARGPVGVTMSPILFNILCSKACHGAIKFGDPLTKEQCSKLLQDLGGCKLPFQCAHGRPSIYPMLELPEEIPAEQINVKKLFLAVTQAEANFLQN
ncbi:uncharacterized protein LOC143446431 isoform X3 [Clavelina lepadiformis]|uniref:uncharacterized protein LOC143446431 isoform X3 n=1 Tax=Clavelina lepadiformis TaxID=159417 RepID=UPI0040436E0F